MFWVVAVNETMLAIGFERGMTGFCGFFFFLFVLLMVVRWVIANGRNQILALTRLLIFLVVTPWQCFERSDTKTDAEKNQNKFNNRNGSST